MPAIEYTEDDLDPADRGVYRQIKAIEQRQLSLSEGTAKVGDPLPTEADGILAAWIAWLHPRELRMLRGVLACGTFIHFGGRTASMKVGANGPCRTKEQKRKDRVHCSLGQDMVADAWLAREHGTTVTVLMETARLREREAWLMRALTEATDQTPEHIEDCMKRSFDVFCPPVNTRVGKLIRQINRLRDEVERGGSRWP